MSVYDYYRDHFSELTPDRQFHFATRIKNYFHSHDFDWFFSSYVPSQDLAATLANNDFSRVNRADLRRPFFEKYDHLFAIEATLFQVNHLLNEYCIDLRPQLLHHLPLERLYRLADDLLQDDAAILTLSSWAVNVICLVEILFPRGQNVLRTLAERVLRLDQQSQPSSQPDPQTRSQEPSHSPTPAPSHSSAQPQPDPLLLLYLYTHLILCDTNFYTRPVSEPDLDRAILDRCAALIERDFDGLFLDIRLEFLVCANLVGVDYPDLRSRIAAECRAQLAQHPQYLIDPRRTKHPQTLNSSEHRNVLYIMSGLDAQPNDTQSNNTHPSDA